MINPLFKLKYRVPGMNFKILSMRTEEFLV